MPLHPISLTAVPAHGNIALAVHGGAGPQPTGGGLSPAQRTGLLGALHAGQRVLTGGGSALEAACLAVTVLEDDPAFNAGRGAALTRAGTAELDACVCDGASGRAGAVAVSRYARNPVLAARAVLEHTPHVLLACPGADWLADVGLATVDPDYFVTPARLTALHAGRSDTSTPAHGHGTVGAVARDRDGQLAAATSTGGVTGQWEGRVGDTPVVGAGTWADRLVAVSGTGIGEHFLRAALAHDIAARLRWTTDPLPQVVRAVLAEDLLARGGNGGVIAAGADGGLVLGYCTPAMLYGYLGPNGPVVADGRAQAEAEAAGWPL